MNTKGGDHQVDQHSHRTKMAVHVICALALRDGQDKSDNHAGVGRLGN